MAYSAILIASIFLILAFAIERLSRVLRVPSVIAMICVGLAAKPLMVSRGFEFEGLEVAVPILGAIGLILIVLEGALDIELRRDRIRTAAGALTMAVAGFILCMAFFASAAALALDLSMFHAALLAAPFAVISSAVAIPSSDFLPERAREFVIYESSVSDIVGVLVFFALLNSTGTLTSVMAGLIGGGALSLLLSTICAVGLMLILVRIDGHIRFIPLLAGLFGLYAVGELLHLSPLIMVLMFGLALNNPKLITNSGRCATGSTTATTKPSRPSSSSCWNSLSPCGGSSSCSWDTGPTSRTSPRSRPGSRPPWCWASSTSAGTSC